MGRDLQDATFELLFDTEQDGAETLKDKAAEAEEGNALRHVASLSMTKLADGFINPKLVLSWLVGALGAPAVFAGLLVPIREAGALLPQLFSAGWVQAQTRRKWIWAAGSLVQGLAAAGIVVAALWLEGWAAGVTICALLAVLAVGRSFCSVSYKDILGRTVGQTRRGTVTGLAGSVASVGVIGFALYLMVGPGAEMTVILVAIGVAAALWIAASLLFSTLDEQPAETTDAGEEGPFAALSYLKEDSVLVRFILTRGLLTATALAPPFLVLMAGGEDGSGLGQLGALVLASALASFASSYVWGRLADRSSRQVLMRSGMLGAVALALAVALYLAGVFAQVWVASGVLFLVMIAYHGVRQGRSTYLTDMAPDEARAGYSAVANTVIGTLLLISGAFGGVASLLGSEWAVAGFCLMSLAAAAVARGLPEVEEIDRG